VLSRADEVIDKMANVRFWPKADIAMALSQRVLKFIV
jgi:hypothetical protein